MHNRVAISFFSLMVIFGILILNIFFTGIDLDIAETAQTANKKSVTLDTSRGMIYDANGQKLVNSQNYNITVCLPLSENTEKVFPYLSSDEKNEFYDNMSKGKVNILSINQNFNDDTIKTVTLSKRYADNQTCVHIIGHLDSENSGAMGLEKAYNSYLSQNSGTMNARWSVNALGHIIHGEKLKFASENYLSPAGIQLTIDLNFQKIAESVLVENNVTKGAVVIMNSDTAEILASASVPTFNPNKLELSIDDINEPFVNRATSAYSVGSVFKPIIASVAIENNIDLTYKCVGCITIGGRKFSCNNGVAHGLVNMETATAKSCNSYFIALGQKIGAERIISLCENLGFNQATEIADNYSIQAGFLPNIQDISSPQELANLSFGQGKLLISPIQMACVYSVFANGGYYREPTLMKAIIDKDGNAIQKVQLPDKCQVLNNSTVKSIDKYLKGVVEIGSGYRAHSDLVIGHGKTATAQSGWFDDGREIMHTWFCGYFDYNDTTYTIVIFKEDGKTGAEDCAPIFKQIAERIVEIKQQ